VHISGAHLHGHASFPAAGAAAAKRAEKLAADTRKKLFSIAEELDASGSAESAWMIGSWGGDGQSGSGQNASAQNTAGDEVAAYGNRSNRGAETDSNIPPELTIEQSAAAGAQWINAAAQSSLQSAAYPANNATGRVERTPQVRQVSYWA